MYVRIWSAPSASDNEDPKHKHKVAKSSSFQDLIPSFQSPNETSTYFEKLFKHVGHSAGDLFRLKGSSPIFFLLNNGASDRVIVHVAGEKAKARKFNQLSLLPIHARRLVIVLLRNSKFFLSKDPPPQTLRRYGHASKM